MTAARSTLVVLALLVLAGVGAVVPPTSDAAGGWKWVGTKCVTRTLAETSHKVKMCDRQYLDSSRPNLRQHRVKFTRVTDYQPDYLFSVATDRNYGFLEAVDAPQTIKRTGSKSAPATASTQIMVGGEGYFNATYTFAPIG